MGAEPYRFPLFDMTGTTHLMVDPYGTVTDQYTLDAFGVETNPGGGFSMAGLGADLGSPASSLEGGGTVLGDGTVGDVQPDSLITTLTPYGFGGAWGYMTDSSGALQLGARFYWPSLGRFIQQDPAGDGDNWYAYVGNNPITGIDPTGLLLVYGGDPRYRADFDEALTYLRGAPWMALTINALEVSPWTYTVMASDTACDQYSDPARGVIDWNPRAALHFTGGTLSPALMLGHELGHAAEDPGWMAFLMGMPGGDYDNAEERRVIQGLENHAAAWLGEDLRSDHRGTYFHVDCPMSRDWEGYMARQNWSWR